MQSKPHRINQLLTAVIMLAVAGGVSADTIFVPGDFPTIQQAIDASSPGDEIIVAAGTYPETIDFLGKAITVRSADGPGVTIIDGGGAGNVVRCVSSEGPDSVLEGFTITGGSASVGGGMFISGSDPTVTGCVFTLNEAIQGGGLYCGSGAPTLTECSFTDNTADLGGGVYGTGSGPLTMTHCSFAGNHANQLGGAGYDHLGSFRMTSCIIDANTSDEHGAGLYLRREGSALTNCLVTHNTAVDEGGGVYIALGGNGPTFTNCTFTANTADRGGAVLVDLGTPRFFSCILWANSAPFGGAGLPIVSYSDVEGGIAGAGNINADPMFVDPDSHDYRLGPGSPCIDAGDNLAVPPGVTTDLDGNPRFVDDPATPDTGQGTAPIVDMGSYEFQAAAVRVLPDAFEVLFGAYVSGGLADLFESDDAYVIIEQRPSFTPLLPLIRMDVTGVSGSDTASALTTTVETATTAIPTQPPQALLHWDFDAAMWEILDERTATLTDSVVQVLITENAGRFIETGTNAVALRLEWFDPGNVFLPAWVVRIDRAGWTVVP